MAVGQDNIGYYIYDKRSHFMIAIFITLFLICIIFCAVTSIIWKRIDNDRINSIVEKTFIQLDREPCTKCGSNNVEYFDGRNNGNFWSNISCNKCGYKLRIHVQNDNIVPSVLQKQRRSN